MNRKEAAQLVLSKLEYFDDLNQDYKTYNHQGKEYKLYGSLNQARLKGETQEEYKVRRLFMYEYNNRKGIMVWNSKNQDSINWFRFAKGTNLKDSPEQMELLKENVIKTNLGTYDKKKIAKFVEELKEKKANENARS